MLKKRYLISVLILFSALTMDLDFKEEQMKSSRVKTAYKEKEQSIKDHLNELSLDINKLEIFIRVFKKEQLVELWGRNKSETKFKKIKTYDFCSSSGVLGPKRKQGDLQIPEGFYHINRFNSWSNFYLSLGLNYPNRSDKILGNKTNPGGDIFIHGDCVTIGCIPITDDKIKELYIYALEAKNNGQIYLYVHIFTSKMDEKEYEKLSEEYADNKDLIDFWANLKEGYDFFERNYFIPTITTSATGKYLFAE